MTTPQQREPRLRAVPALSRGVAVLRLLARSEAPMGVQAVARELALVPSTCLHILRVLTEERLVAVDPLTRRYTIGTGLVALARTALRGHTFASAVQGELASLARRYDATALAVEAVDLDHMVVVGLARAAAPLQINVDIGSRFPALISATGRCVAARTRAPWGEVQRRFAKLRWDDPPTLAIWRAEVKAARETGYAIDEGRYIAGVAVVAASVAASVAVPDAIRALVVVGLAERLRQVGLDRIGEDLRERAGRVATALNGE